MGLASYDCWAGRARREEIIQVKHDVVSGKTVLFSVKKLLLTLYWEHVKPFKKQKKGREKLLNLNSSSSV